MKKIIFAVLFLTTSSIFAQPSTKYDISGKWYAYDANGERQWKLDISIFYNEDLEAYYAKYDERFLEVSTDGVLHYDKDHSVAMQKTQKITIESDSSFSFDKYWQYIVKDAQRKRWQYQTLVDCFSCTISLHFIPDKDKLIGRVKFNRYFSAMGHSDYETVEEAVKNGAGTVLEDCDGNCGGMDVVYRRW